MKGCDLKCGAVKLTPHLGRWCQANGSVGEGGRWVSAEGRALRESGERGVRGRQLTDAAPGLTKSRAWGVERGWAGTRSGTREVRKAGERAAQGALSSVGQSK